MVDLAASVWRDFVTDGVPASGPNKPNKAKIRAWGTWLEAQFFGRPYINVVSDFGAKADVVSVTTTVSIASGTAGLTAIGAAFTSDDIGKSVFVPGAGAAGTMLASKIVSVADATHITLQDNASTTLSSVSKIVKYWTNQSTAFQAAINAAVAIKGTVFVPSGNYGFDGANAGSLNPGAGDIAFIGDGKSILTYFEGESTATRYLFRNDANSVKGSLYFGPGICFQGTLDAYGRRAGNPLWLDFYTNITLDDCEWLNLAAEGMDIHYGNSLTVRNCRMNNLAADGIRCRDVPNVVITGNYIQRNGDDAIACHTSNALTTGSREGIIIANNHLVNTGMIRVLSSRVVTIVDNRLELVGSQGIYIGGNIGGEGTLPSRDVIVANNQILDLIDMNTLTGVISGGTAAGIYISMVPSVGQASTHTKRPGQYDATAAAWVFPWTYDEVDVTNGASVVPPAYGISIRGNSVRRTRPAVANFSLYGFGTRLGQGVQYDPAINDAALRAGFGVTTFTALSVSSMLVADNIIDGVTQGIGLAAPTYTGQIEHVIFARNIVRDCTNRGLTVTSASVTIDVVFDNNDIDCDTYRQNANSNVNGTYTALSVPRGIDVGNLVGAKFTRNRFRNCCQPIACNFPAQNYFEGNILSCQPVAAALGFTNTNKGIGVLEAADGRFVYEIIDADPTSATYGGNTNTQLLSSTAMPAAGYYVVGAYVKNAAPTLNGPVGWSRLTNGSAHVLNTDWLPVYATGVLAENSKALGYIAGAGGAVAQATDKTTGVTLNRPSGQITMQATSLASATAVSFTLTNSTITADDVLILNHKSGGTIGAYTINAQCTAGQAVITIRNNTAGALAEALVLQYALVQGATT